MKKYINILRRLLMALSNCYKGNIFSKILPSDLGSSYNGPFVWRSIPCTEHMNCYNTSENANERIGPFMKFENFPAIGQESSYIGAWLALTVQSIQAGNGSAFTDDLNLTIWSHADFSWTPATAFASKPAVVYTGKVASWGYSDIIAEETLLISADANSSESAGLKYHYAANSWGAIAGLTFAAIKFETPLAWIDEDPEVREYTGVTPNKWDKTVFFPHTNALACPFILIGLKRSL
jgi:hypothetical protein